VSGGGERLWREPWVAHVSVEAARIEHAAMTALAGRPPDAAARQAATAIEQFLAATRKAIRSRGLGVRGPFDRWRGISIELAYRNLHAARVGLVDLLPASECDALIPSVIARAEVCLQPEELRRMRLDSLAQEHGERRRVALKYAMRAGLEASDQLYTRIRGFRNILLSAAALIALFVGGLVLIVSRSPASMPLCFQPSITVLQSTASGITRTVCPSGEDREPLGPPQTRRRPEPGDVRIVAGLGLLGGALAAAFAIRKIKGTSTPYDVPIAIALLKVPSGALTAVAGILLLGGGFVPGLSELDSQRQILAYALVFGYAQQLATRFIDDRAQTILGSVPGKPSDAERTPTQPGPSTVPPSQPGPGTVPPSQPGPGTVPPSPSGPGTVPPSRPGPATVPPSSSGRGTVPPSPPVPDAGSSSVGGPQKPASAASS
jgi:hypothetical protein